MVDVRTIVGVLMVAGTCPAHAGIKDYQIIRLLAYKSECQVNEVKAVPSLGKTLRFAASCANVTFYPDGVEIMCEDPDDDRACRVLTRPQTFGHLRSLTPGR